MPPKSKSLEKSTRSSETKKTNFSSFKKLFKNSSSDSSKKAIEVHAINEIAVERNLFDQEYSDNQMQVNSDNRHNEIAVEKNLFEDFDSQMQVNPDNRHSERIRDQYRQALSSSSELIGEAYSKAMVDNEIFRPARETLERFDHEINGLVNQSKDVYEKASRIERFDKEQTIEEDTLDNRITSAANLITEVKNEWNRHKNELLHLKDRIYDASQEFFSPSPEMEIYTKLRSAIDKIDGYPLQQLSEILNPPIEERYAIVQDSERSRLLRTALKQKFIQDLGGQDNLWQYINQSKIQSLGKVDSQIATINTTIEKTTEALQTATNYHHQLERQRERQLESEAVHYTLQQRLTEGNAELQHNQATLDATKRSAQKVQELLNRCDELHKRTDQLNQYDFKSGTMTLKGHFNHQINLTETLIGNLESHQEMLRQIQQAIISKENQLSSIHVPGKISDRLESIMNRIEDPLKQKIEQEVGKYDDRCQKNNESKMQLIEEAKLQLEAIKAYTEKTTKALQTTRDYNHQLGESQTVYKTLQERLIEVKERLQDKQTTLDTAKRSVQKAHWLLNDGTRLHERADADQLNQYNFKSGTMTLEGHFNDRIHFTTRLMTELEKLQKKLRQTQQSIISEKERLFSINSTVEDFAALQQTLVNKITINDVKEKILGNFHHYIDQCLQIDQNVRALQEEAKSQLETIDASIEKTTEAWQTVKNYNRQLGESQTAYKTLQGRLIVGEARLEYREKTSNAINASFEASAQKVKEFVNQGRELHMKANMLGSDRLKDDTTKKGPPLDEQINSTTKLITELDKYQKMLHKMQIPIKMSRGQLSPINSTVEDFAKLQPTLMNEITIKDVKERILEDFGHYLDQCLRIDRNAMKLQEEATSQIETINSSIKETTEALQIATSYHRQLQESQTL